MSVVAATISGTATMGSPVASAGIEAAKGLTFEAVATATAGHAGEFEIDVATKLELVRISYNFV